MKRIVCSRLFKCCVIAIFVGASLFGMFIHQTRFGVSVSGMSLWMTNVEQAELDEYIAHYSDPSADDYLFLRADERFPSKDAGDYRKIYVYVDLKNSSFLDYSLYDSYVSYAGNNSNVSFAITFGGDKMKAGTRNSYVSCCMLFTYCPGMSDTKIKDHLQDYEISLYLSNAVFKDLKCVYDVGKHSLSVLSKNPYDTTNG